MTVSSTSTVVVIRSPMRGSLRNETLLTDPMNPSCTSSPPAHGQISVPCGGRLGHVFQQSRFRERAAVDEQVVRPHGQPAYGARIPDAVKCVDFHDRGPLRDQFQNVMPVI